MGFWVVDIGVEGLDEVASSVVLAVQEQRGSCLRDQLVSRQASETKELVVSHCPFCLANANFVDQIDLWALPVAGTWDECLIRSLNHEQVVTAEQYSVIYLQLLPLLVVLKRTQWRCEVTSWHVVESDSHGLALLQDSPYHRPVRVKVEHILVTTVPCVAVIPLSELCLIRANLVQEFRDGFAG